MSEPSTLAIGIVAIITALGSAGAVFFKYIRKSDCFCFHVETRTPPETPAAPLPTPIIHRKNLDSNIREVDL